METKSSAVNPYNGLFGQQGWICPMCGRVYSPFTSMCLYCVGGDTTITSNYVRFMRQNWCINEEKLREDRKQDQL